MGTIWEQSLVAKRMLWTFYEFMIWCEEHNIKTPIIAGDFFDTRLIPPKLVGDINAQLRQYANRGIRPIFVNGNHEEDKWNGSALQYLNEVHCKIVREPSVIMTVEGTTALAVPFVYGLSAEEALDKALEELSLHYAPDSVRLLVGHFGLYSDGAALWEQNDRLSLHVNHVKKRLAGTNIRVVAVGHYHNRSHYEFDDLDLYQIGSLSPRNFGESGAAYGNILEVDGLANSDEIGATHYLGACAGVRYVAHPDQFRGHFIKELELEPVKRCWYIARDALQSFPISVPVVSKPKEIMEVQSGAFTSARYDKQHEKPYYDGDEIGPRGISSQRAVQHFVQRKMTTGEFKGPIPGLATEAVSRTKGTEGNSVVTAPRLENPVPWKLH